MTETVEHVYLIGSLESPRVKIGRSTNITKRLANIQAMSPAPLTVLWQHVGGDELEKALHRWFRAERRHGEWFELGDDPIPAVAAATAAILAGQQPLLDIPPQATEEPEEVDLTRPPLGDPDRDTPEYQPDENGCRQFTPGERRAMGPDAGAGVCRSPFWCRC